MDKPITWHKTLDISYCSDHKFALPHGPECSHSREIINVEQEVKLFVGYNGVANCEICFSEFEIVPCIGRVLKYVGGIPYDTQDYYDTYIICDSCYDELYRYEEDNNYLFYITREAFNEAKEKYDVLDVKGALIEEPEE